MGGKQCGRGTEEQGDYCVAVACNDAGRVAAVAEPEITADARREWIISGKPVQLRPESGGCLDVGRRGKDPYLEDEYYSTSDISKTGIDTGMMHCNKSRNMKYIATPTAIFRVEPINDHQFRVYTACEGMDKPYKECNELSDDLVTKRCLRRDGDKIMISKVCDDVKSIFSQTDEGTKVTADDGRCLYMNEIATDTGRRLHVGDCKDDATARFSITPFKPTGGGALTVWQSAVDAYSAGGGGAGAAGGAPPAASTPSATTPSATTPAPTPAPPGAGAGG